MLINIGAFCLGAFVGILTAQFLYPILRTQISAEKRVILLRRVLVIVVVGVIGPVAGIGLVGERDAAGCYAIGLLVGFMAAFCWEEIRSQKFVRKATLAGRTVKQTLKDPKVFAEPPKQAELEELLDQLGPESFWSRVQKRIKSLFG